MSTLDKINSELGVLQGELEQLHHYTVEIGNAKDASASVISLSRSFLETFQKSINEIDTEMNKAAEDFQSHCSKVSGDFDTATTEFNKGIAQARSTLNEISLQLATAATNVNDLTRKIEDINILGHFQRIHTTLEEMQIKFSDNHQSVLKNVEAIEIKLVSEIKRLNTWVIVCIVLAGLAVIGIGILLAK